ncbi:RagB/SusD family nutrient uptake outer membrane protein [Zobellia uliginosa]|uniref:RagB/SusD family nutrient uptake outer membrane protein n=1 Tax=Zobellia uliginosa TaxID=143224 RepID=UPI001C065922|nr:RagB/SusD family nutrient uptake outer membrane protein [Zobellia uliginosa]MBU2945976.1 RagB/SusD family nutrient uptake outer membrane protein [Zobellia uliginosa]
MKKLNFILISFLMLLASCEDVLDKEPLDRIPENSVWLDQNLTDAYLTDVYSNVVFKRLSAGNSGNHVGFGLISGMSDELTQFAPWQEPNIAIATPMNSQTLYEPLNYWKYDVIRKANIFIEEVGNSELDEDFKKKRIAEARWIRAYLYFEMVKRWGGIPLITGVQNLTDDPETIFIPRNTEQEIYDFVDAEMNAIFNDLPNKGDTEGGRVNKWAVKALQSRAMLFAASIARFGTVQLDGIVGMPEASETTYWQKSYDASKELIENSPLSLYEKFDDPVTNHHQLFIDEIEDNPEVIFTERYDAGSGLGQSHALLAVPAEFATGWNSNFRVFLDIAEKFEFEDGTTGAIPRDQYAAQEWDMDELFNNRDPRFKAAFFYNGTDFWDRKAYFHESSLVNGEVVTSGVLPDGMAAKVANRTFEARPKPLRHGFLLRKFLDESTGSQLDDDQSSEDFHIFRLGETYLNMAEAAFYLGKTDEALTLVNRIRQRAGMPPKLVIDEETIRNERAVELVFEEHRFWDIRRWRIAVDVLNDKMMMGLKFVYNHDTGKFKIEVKNALSNPRVFLPENYYYPLTFDKISDNPKFVENPGY